MLITDSITYTLARVLPGILAIGTTAVLTRLLEPQKYGIFALAQVVMVLVSNIAFDWLGPSLQRLYEAHRGDPRTFATFVHVYLALVVGSAVVTLLVWVLGGFRNGQGAIYVLGIVLAWGFSSFELVSQFEIVNFRPLRYLRMNVVRAVLVFLGASGAAWITHDPFWTAVFVGVGMFGGALQGSFLAERLGPRYFNGDLVAEIMSYGLPMAVSIMMLGIAVDGTRFMLEILNSPESLGLYTASFVLVRSSLLFIGTGIGSAGFPLAVQAVENGDPAVIRRQLLDNGTLLLAIMAPASLGLALTARGFATTMLGAEYQSTAIVLTPWMAATAFLATIRSQYLDNAFHLSRRTSLLVWVAAVAAISATALSLILLPRLGPLGVAISVTVAMAISCCHAAIAGRSVFRMPIPIGSALRVLICCAFMTLIVLWIPPAGPTAFVMQILLGGLGYGGTAVALNVLDLRTHLVSYFSHRT